MRNIDLDSLEVFRAVVTEGGVVRASTKLHRVQSNVSARIQQLEQRMGQPLFHRRGRSLTLAPAGQALLPYAERLLRLADEAEREITAGLPAGSFKLGALESTAGSRLPPLLSRFHRTYPDVAVELVTDTTGALLRRVDAFELEAAFISEPFSAPSGLSTRPVFEEELVLITTRNLTSVTRSAQLGEATLIAFAQGCSYRLRAEQWLGKLGVRPARVLELSSYQAMIACVAAGTGFAVVPRSLLDALRASADVRQHPLPARLRTSRTHIAWRGTPSVTLTRLLEMLT